MEVHQRLIAEQVANHPFVLRHMPPEAAGGAAPEEAAEVADEADSAEAFAAEAAAGEVAEAAAPEHTAAETGNKPKKKLNNKLKKKLMVMLKRKKKPKNKLKPTDQPNNESQQIKKPGFCNTFQGQGLDLRHPSVPRVELQSR